MTIVYIKCNCGRNIEVYSMWANECSCGAEYNGSGQRLAPRSQWGYETGESFGGGYEEDY